VLERLWRATIEDRAHALTLARLEQLGGAQRIVDSHLQQAVGTLSKPQQAVAADAFRFLVTRSKTKIAQNASNLPDWPKRPEPEVSAVHVRRVSPADVVGGLTGVCRCEAGGDAERRAGQSIRRDRAPLASVRAVRSVPCRIRSVTAP
jgi:hypothetical protein